MRRPIAILALAVVACLSWVGPALAAEEAGYTDVSVIDNVFGPRIVRVPVGGEVASTNNGCSVHNVVADDGSFRSSALQPGDGFERIFDRPGVYPYVYLVVLTGAFVRRYRPLPVDVPARPARSWRSPSAAPRARFWT